MRIDRQALCAALILFILLAGCAPAVAPSGEGAGQALNDYFTYLNTGEYEKADALYGGSYDELIAMNPDVDPDDHAALWQRACTVNGLQCLPARSIILAEARGGVYFFKVTFTAPDGSTFVLGPCCGATETEMPPASVFDYSVMYANGKYLVINLPVFMP